jgi:hypothetical protein
MDALLEVGFNTFTLAHRCHRAASTPSIEMAFSKLKAALRKGAKRNVKKLWVIVDFAGTFSVLSEWRQICCQDFQL